MVCAILSTLLRRIYIVAALLASERNERGQGRRKGIRLKKCEKEESEERTYLIKVTTISSVSKNFPFNNVK